MVVDYSDTIEVHGVRVPFVEGIMTQRLEKTLRSGRYVRGEMKLVTSMLRPGDRFLEIGCELGVVLSTAAKMPGVAHVLSVESNPQKVDVIQETLQLNKLSNAEVRHGLARAEDRAPVPFYIRDNFWDGSLEPGTEPHRDTVEVPVFGLEGLLAEQKPTLLSCHFLDLARCDVQMLDLSTVRHLLLKVHPKARRKMEFRRVVDALAAQGFVPDHVSQTMGNLQRFDRVPAPTVAPSAAKSDAPRVLVPTCMKNEGPFILEWLAWNRAIGVTDFVVFTNDCTDGTDVLLDHLAARGFLRHMPNPALAVGVPHFQPVALNYVPHLPEYKAADYVISIDVDEFLNIRVGDHTLAALFDAAGRFDVLSATDLNHGCNGQHRFEPGLLTEQFPGHQTERPGKQRSLRGVKSIVRLGPRVERVRNHRPDLREDLGQVIWLDGSGTPRSTLLEEPGDNGWDCRGSYDLVSLDHFPLRSLESFLVKMHRGDVVVEGKKVSQRYWRTRNHSDNFTSDLAPGLARMQEELDALMADPETRRLHEACVAAHRARIDALSGEEEYIQRKSWIYREAWHAEYPEEALPFLDDTQTQAKAAEGVLTDD